MNVDVICPLYKAEEDIDTLIDGIKRQNKIEIQNVIFAVTKAGNYPLVVSKIEKENFKYFFVEHESFSHSLTREEAIYKYCDSDIVIMLSQDVKLIASDAMYELANVISDEVVYAYGKQICLKKTIEHYTRSRNYGEKTFFVNQNDIPKLQLTAFFASDAFAAYHRPTFCSINGYDHIPMMMNEDMYYAKKIIDLGYKKAYVATAIVEHSHKFSLKQLYKRYYATGVWFSEHPEFNCYRTTDSGLKFALYIFWEALKDFNFPVLFRWLPDMAARYIGLKKGKRNKDLEMR